MSVPARFALSVSVLFALSVGVGVLLADDDEVIEWPVTVGLAALAVAGETLRTWLRRAR